MLFISLGCWLRWCDTDVRDDDACDDYRSIAIIIALTITVMTMSIKTLEAFLRIFVVWIYKTEALHPILLPRWKEYLLLLMPPERLRHICVRWILNMG